MKKRIPLLMLFLTIISISCSKDDSPANNDKPFSEKIIGTWALRDRTEFGIDYCELSTTFKFSENNHFILDFYQGDSPDDCQSQIAKGVWTYLEGENMEIDFDELDEIDTLNIQFKNNAQTMKLQNSASSSYTETFVKQ